MSWTLKMLKSFEAEKPLGLFLSQEMVKPTDSSKRNKKIHTNRNKLKKSVLNQNLKNPHEYLK